MIFWQWLTSPTGIPVIIAFIGVSGTLLGVLVSVLTQALLQRRVDRRETERLAFERERWQFEQNALEVSKHEERRREAYIGYLHSGITLQMLFHQINQSRRKFAFSRFGSADYQAALDQWALRIIEIRILAPEVHSITFKTGDQMHLVHNNLENGIPIDDELDELSNLLAQCRREMQRSLGIEPEGGIAKVPVQYNWGSHERPFSAWKERPPITRTSLFRRFRRRKDLSDTDSGAG